MEHFLGIHTSDIQNDGKDTYFNHRYEPTPYEVLEEFFTQYPLSKLDHFVDYGCGAGRVLFYLNHKFHCHTTGVEFNPKYYELCKKNLLSYKGIHKEQLQFVLSAAQDYVVEDEQNIFYFFNPFSIEIFMGTISRIQDSLTKSPRKITIIMYYPDSEYLYYLDTCTEFKLSTNVPISALHRKDERECFIIYQN